MSGWNVLLYVIGTKDDLRIENAANQSFVEMQKVLAQATGPGDLCRVGMQLHTQSGATRSWLEGETSENIPVPPSDGHSDDSDTITKFLKAATDKWGSANRTALIIWAHGSGLDEVHYPSSGPKKLEVPLEIPRVGPDPGSGTFLSNKSIREGIGKSTAKKVDLLAFNACSMGLVEIAYEMRDVCDVFMGAQVDDRAWPYGAIVQRLVDASGGAGLSAEDAAGAVTASIDAARPSLPTFVSAIRTTSLPALRESVDALGDRLLALMSSRWEDVQAIVTNAIRPSSVVADLGALASAVRAIDHSATNGTDGITAQLTDVISVAIGKRAASLSGFSILLPIGTKIDFGAAYGNLQFKDGPWHKFVLAYHKKRWSQSTLGRRLIRRDLVP